MLFIKYTSYSSIRMNFNFKLYSCLVLWVICCAGESEAGGICPCRPAGPWGCVWPRRGTLSQTWAGRLGSDGSSWSAWRWLCPPSWREPPPPSSLGSSAPVRTCLLEGRRKSSDLLLHLFLRSLHRRWKLLLFPEREGTQSGSALSEMSLPALPIPLDEIRRTWEVCSMTSHRVSPPIFATRLQQSQYNIEIKPLHLDGIGAPNVIFFCPAIREMERLGCYHPFLYIITVKSWETVPRG